MPWFTKKERRRQVSAFPAIFKVDFTLFLPFPACFGRISSVRRESKPIQHESSRVGANSRKKKCRHKPTHGQPRRAASDAGVAPLVPHSCFLRYLCLKTPFPQNLFLFIMSFGQEFPARNTAAVAVHRTGIVFHSLKKLA